MDSVDCTCSGVKIEALTPPVQHAEGPHWDNDRSVLYYVDTFTATIIRYDFSKNNRKFTQKKLEGRDSVGIIVPIRKKENEFIVAADRYVFKLVWDPRENNTRNVQEIHMVDDGKPKNQFNDGKADAEGRLWIGTLTREADLSVSPNGGALYRFDPGQGISRQIDNTSISNGLAWSSDNKKFYYCDSETRKIVEYDFDLKTGNLGQNKVLFNLDDYPRLNGIPDGLTIDDNDNLWIALYGGHGIIHVNGKTGKLIRYVKLPAKYCTSACFGGPDRDILFVTTSRLKLNDDEKREEPNAGTVFAVKGLGVKGPAPFEAAF